MNKNFADQPTFHSGVQDNDVLSAKDFKFADISNEGMFLKNPIFVDNCKSCGSMKNFGNANIVGVPTRITNKKNFNLDDGIGLVKLGLGTWSDDQKRQAESEQLNLALQIEEQKRLLAEQQAQADIIKSQNQASIVKSYGLPIAIAGGVIILGIATYFLVKNK